MAPPKRTTKKSSAGTGSLSGKVAVVVNAAEGTVRQIALELAWLGANVVATYDNPKDAPAMASLMSNISTTSSTTSPSPKCLAVFVDPRTPLASASALVTKTVATFGPRVDILINTPYESPFSRACPQTTPYTTTGSRDSSSSSSATNVYTTLSLPVLFKPFLPENGGGRVISMVSVGDRDDSYTYSSYPPSPSSSSSSESEDDDDDDDFCDIGAAVSELSGSSKTTLERMTQTWAQELRLGGHTANVLDMGAEEGEMFDGVPLEDTLRFVAWLVSGKSAAVTGRVLSPAC